MIYKTYLILETRNNIKFTSMLVRKNKNQTIIKRNKT